MIKVKEFYAEVRNVSGIWGIVKGVDEYINDFLKENKDIQVMDIKYTSGPIGDSSQTFALLIYKEK